MEYQEFRSLYERLYGVYALAFLNRNNAKTEKGMPVVEDILQWHYQKIGSALDSLFGDLGNVYTPEIAARFAHEELCEAVKKTFLRCLSREKTMALQAILGIGCNVEIVIDECARLNDHTLVYGWNEQHPDERSLVVGRGHAIMVASSLSELRAIAGLTQKGLAAAAGVDIRQIQKIESGDASIENARAGTVIRMAKALGVEAMELLKVGERQNKNRKENNYGEK